MDIIQIRKQYHALFVQNANINLSAGWVWLLAGLCHALDEHMHNTEEGQRIFITAMNPDRGKLLIMHTKGDIILRAMISAVELTSKHVCQSCGESKEVGQTGGWPILTLCRTCWSNEPKHRLQVLHPHQFLPEEKQSIELAIRAMRDHWFRTALLKLL